MRGRRLAVVAVAVLVTSCAAGAASTPASTPSDGLLVVTQEMARSGAVYGEGYVPFITVSRDGQDIFTARMQFDRPLSRSLGAGSYLLTFTVRPCDANCGYLDPAAETCSVTFTMKPDQTVRAHAIERPGHDCMITTSS
jgi:hypothetical protein